MKKLLSLLLICCLVLAMGAQAGAYHIEKEVNADDFTNALVDYCNGNVVHEMTESDVRLSGYYFKSYDVVKTNDALDFKFECYDDYCPVWFFFWIWYNYSFCGEMHVDKPHVVWDAYPWNKHLNGLRKPYTLNITPDGNNFTARGENWRMNASYVHFINFV